MKASLNLFFICILTFLIVCPISGLAANYLQSGRTLHFSLLEGRTYQSLPKLSLESTLYGQFQGEVEKYLSDHIPGRENILLVNALAQRRVIEFANILFSYPAYHSFYDSPRLIIPDYGAIIQKPNVINSESAKKLHSQAEALSLLIKRHPNLAWCLAIPDRSTISLASPAHALVSQPEDYIFLKRELFNYLPSECKVIDLSITDTDIYFSQYYLSDHHWRANGAVEAYRKIITALGKEPIPYTIFNFDSGPYCGSNARNGLCTTYYDSADDIRFKLGNIEVSVDGKPCQPSWLNASYVENYSGYKREGIFQSIYDGFYFHDDKAIVKIENKDLTNGEALLIVSDSYSDNIDAIFSAHYQFVYTIDTREFEKDGYLDWDIDSFIENEKIDTILFLCAENNLRTSLETLVDE